MGKCRVTNPTASARLTAPTLQSMEVGRTEAEAEKTKEPEQEAKRSENHKSKEKKERGKEKGWDGGTGIPCGPVAN
jgi:hypothetical protein